MIDGWPFLLMTTILFRLCCVNLRLSAVPLKTSFKTSSAFLCLLNSINNRGLFSATVKNRLHPVQTITRASRNFQPEPAWLHNCFSQMWSRRKTHSKPPARMENNSDSLLQGLSPHCDGSDTPSAGGWGIGQTFGKNKQCSNAFKYK